MLLKFTHEGKFLLQIGGATEPDSRRHRVGGNTDTKSVHQSADAFVYAPRPTRSSSPTATATAASIVFDADTGAFKRMWGAFGNDAD